MWVCILDNFFDHKVVNDWRKEGRRDLEAGGPLGSLLQWSWRDKTEGLNRQRHVLPQIRGRQTRPVGTTTGFGPTPMPT